MPPISAEAVLSIIREMLLPERKRLAALMEGPPDALADVGYVVFPRDHIELLLKALNRSLKSEKESVGLVVDQGRRLQRHKSSPEIIRRNVEICNLRRQDARKWTQGRLGRTYHVTARAIRKVLADEEKWRKLAAKLGTD